MADTARPGHLAPQSTATMARSIVHFVNSEHSEGPGFDPADRQMVLMIAARAVADWRTVAKFGRGERVRGDLGERIRRAVAELNAK